MKNSLIIFNSLLLLVVLFFGFKVFNLHSEKHLNVILISIDALRADEMSLYGYSKKTTPNIDNWAQNASVFTNVRTVVPMTQPSFSALFTGIEPFNTGIISNGSPFIDFNTPTLMTVLANHGYTTTAFTANFAGLKNQFQNFNYYAYKDHYNDEAGVERYIMDASQGSTKMIRDAAGWLNRNSSKQFFMWLHLMDVHAPYYPADKYRCEFDTKYCPELLGKRLDQIDADRAQYQMCQEKPVPQDRIDEMRTVYDGGVAQADDYVGQILAKIKSLGLDKNSIIVLYADHGEGLDHDYLFNHRAVLYDSAVHIPLVIYDPLVSSYNKRSDMVIENTDIMPTILSLVGISSSGLNIDGHSFANIIDGDLVPNLNYQPRKYVYSVNSNWTKFSIFDGRYKYIYSLPESCVDHGQTEELYDTRQDPKELKNLVKSNSQKTKDLKKQLFYYLSKYNLPASGTLPAEMQDGDDAGSNAQDQKLQDEIRSMGY